MRALPSVLTAFSITILCMGTLVRSTKPKDSLIYTTTAGVVGEVSVVRWQVHGAWGIETQDEKSLSFKMINADYPADYSVEGVRDVPMPGEKGQLMIQSQHFFSWKKLDWSYRWQVVGFIPAYRV